MTAAARIELDPFTILGPDASDTEVRAWMKQMCGWWLTDEEIQYVHANILSSWKLREC